MTDRVAAERVLIGTQLLSLPESSQMDGSSAAPPTVTVSLPGTTFPGTDGTLLAVVPIPGTGTSLAIVGYPVTTGAAAPSASGRSPGVTEGRNGPPTASGLVLDHGQRRVWADGQEIVLTYQEFELLAFLSAHPATVFSRADLVARVWQRDFSADSRTVDVHVSRLRHKLGAGYGGCLITEYRVGYQFRPPVSTADVSQPT